VKVWSTETWQPVEELAVNGSARCLFSPDGRWLVTGSPVEYCFWEVGSWNPGLKMPRDHAGDMYGALALSPNGRMAALLHGRNRGVKLISIPDGRELAALDTGEPLCFSEDGGQLATTGEDHRTLLVWDLRLIRNGLRVLKLDWD
jgi:WD40 repeat protein